MADIKQLERALIKADAAGDEEAAKAFAAEIRKMRTAPAAPVAAPTPDYAAEARANIDAERQQRNSTARAAGQKDAAGAIGGAAMGVADLGRTVLSGGAKVAGLVSPQAAQFGRTLNADFEAITEQNRDSAAFNGGRIAGNIAATLPVGGALGQTVRAVAPGASGFANALASGGFRAAALPAGTSAVSRAAGANMLTRMAGGAVAGGAATGLVSPDNAGMGALIGGALPPMLSGAGKLAGYAGRSAGSLVQPFTASGQDAIAGKIVRKFAEGGPTALNAQQLVPGSLPTLAEATGNAGLATLQRGARDIAPNAFAARESGNALARNADFDDLAGDVGKLDFFRSDRAAVGKQLYDEALSVVPAPPTPYLKGQITQLLKRPSINEASKKAQQWAIERGEKPYMNGSMRGLHDTKTALDDMINEAVMKGQGGHAKALEATQAKLLDVMEKMSPGYKEARVTYATMSQPVNAMEALQGLKLTDAKGNMTLSKVKNAIESLERAQNGAGISAAKSIDAQQMKALKAIHADLLRQASLDGGRSIGSNTFQNIATDNMLTTMLPGALGKMATGKAGTLFGQFGQLAFNKPNEAIRNRLAEIMLDPQLAHSALNPAAPRIGSTAARFNALMDRSGPSVYRSAPLLSSDR